MPTIQGMTAKDSQSLRLDYLNLLVTQLRHQNPLEPMDSGDMTSQLSQIAQLEQMEKANGNFEAVLSAARSGYASSLIGRQVEFEGEDGSIPGSGRVAGVEWLDGDLFLDVEGKAVALEAIRSLSA
jgi:flagellar basal-body rod modification protein FlgD